MVLIVFHLRNNDKRIGEYDKNAKRNLASDGKVVAGAYGSFNQTSLLETVSVEDAQKKLV